MLTVQVRYDCQLWVSVTLQRKSTSCGIGHCLKAVEEKGLRHMRKYSDTGFLGFAERARWLACCPAALSMSLRDEVCQRCVLREDIVEAGLDCEDAFLLVGCSSCCLSCHGCSRACRLRDLSTSTEAILQQVKLDSASPYSPKDINAVNVDMSYLVASAKQLAVMRASLIAFSTT